MRSPMSLRRVEALRRLLLRSLLAGGLIAGVIVLFAGCRENRAVVRTDGVRLTDLRQMVVPRDELGLAGIGMRLDDAGWTPNRAAARESLDPDDTGRSLARAGRLGGYSLVYDRSGLPGDEHPLSVGTEVELFRDDASASAYLRRQVATALRLRGKRLPVGRVARVNLFRGGDVGDESEGLHQTVVVRRGVGYGTTIGFRDGRVVASVGVLHRVETGGPGDVRSIAATLERRIASVAAGELRAATR